jgi:hypothetical protein
VLTRDSREKAGDWAFLLPRFSGSIERSQEGQEAAKRLIELDSAQFLSRLTASAKRNTRCFSTEQLSPTRQGIQG